MKKTLLMALCMMGGIFASAQLPAGATQKDGEEIFKQGQADIKVYDDMLGRKQLGMLKDGEGYAAAQKLVSAYDKFIESLPYDQIPDAKGKVKPKYTKKVWSQLQGHLADYDVAALDFWNAKDFDGAYRSWDIFFELINSPEIEEKAKAFAPDSVMANVAYNQGIAAWQADKLENAVKSFRKAIKLGYPKKEAYIYGISVAAGAKDNDALLEFAEKGNHLFGAEDPQFINQIINYYLNTEKYDEALDFLNKAIAENPGQPQYYALQGIIYDNKEDRPAAMVQYEKALSMDPNNGLANFYYGRALASKASDMSDNYADTATFPKYKAEQIDPIFRQAVNYLEKAYEVDPNNRSQVLKVLDLVYYQLNDQAGVDSVKQRQLED